MEQILRTPAHPCLRAGTEIVTVDRDTVLLRSFSRTVMLSGEFVSSELLGLLSHMDGNTTIQELTAKVSDSIVPDFERFLALLLNKGFLVEGEQGGTEVNRHQHAYWSLQGASPLQVARRFESSSVVIVNLGAVGLTVARSLAESGVGKITAIDAGTVRVSDIGLGYRTEEIGTLRVDAVSRDLSSKGYRGFVPLASSVHGLSNWDGIVAGANLVVLCGDGMSLAAYDRTNEACMRHRTRWVSARIDRTRGIIGPFIVPEQTPCFTCFELRSRSNAEHPEDHAALYRHWRSADEVPDDWPVASPFAGILGNYLALDIQRVLAGNQLSMFLGRMFHIDYQTGESRYHDILKLPRCPACSRERNRPLTKIWDIRPVAAAVGSH